MRSKFLFLMVTFFLIVTCSTLKNDKTMGTNAEKKTSKTPPAIPTSIEAKQAGSEVESNFVTEITFPEGEQSVPVAAKSAIKKLYDQANKKGKIESVKIITWADMEYPSQQKQELPNAQLKLVEDRNDNIQAYLENLNEQLEVDKISMAERPGVMEDIMDQEDVELKKSLETAGIPTGQHNQENTSKASKSIVMFVLDKEQR